MIEPTLERERAELARYPLIIACDEVGRGALAGPVAVGAVAMEASFLDASAERRRIPEGLRDSKLVPEKRRAALARAAAAWVAQSAVGWASADEVDEIGIIPALGLAARRALADLKAHGVPIEEALVILDGNHDYITRHGSPGLRVQPVVKADRDCASAAAASVIAKVARDDLMRIVHDDVPAYGWDRNKGYASADHRAAIREHGLSPLHRASWAIGDASAVALF